MEFDANVELLRIAFWQIIMTAGPLLGVALAIGLLVGIIQAATSINEMTLSFVPKLGVVIFTFGMLSTFMLTQLSDFVMFTFDQISRVASQLMLGLATSQPMQMPGVDLQLVMTLLLQYFVASLRIGALVSAALRRPLATASGSDHHGA